MELLQGLLQQLMGDPKIQAVTLGLAVKCAVDFLKGQFTALDADNVKQYALPVQALVAICTTLATLGSLYLSGGLHTIALDPTTIVNFITVALPVYLSAMGIHLFAKQPAVQKLRAKLVHK